MRTTIIAISMITVVAMTSYAQETDPPKRISEQWVAAQERQVMYETRLHELDAIIDKEMATMRTMSPGTERQALMQTHRNHMLEAVGLMVKLGDPGLRDVLAEHAGPQSVDDAHRLMMLEDRLDMIVVMMESLLTCANDTTGC